MQPSQSDLERVQVAIEQAQLSEGPVYVSSKQNSGFGHYMAIVILIPREEVTAETLRQVLQIIYDNTPEGYRPQFLVTLAEPDPSDTRFGLGKVHLIKPLLEELGLPHPREFDYFFTRVELAPLFG